MADSIADFCVRHSGVLVLFCLTPLTPSPSPLRLPTGRGGAVQALTKHIRTLAKALPSPCRKHVGSGWRGAGGEATTNRTIKLFFEVFPNDKGYSWH